MPDQTLFTVLCVDDNEGNRYATSRLLAHERYRVREAGTGEEALLLAKQADLVVLDVRLPGLNGVEVCRRLKADPATTRTPVILLSGHLTEDENKAEGLENGGDAYLIKPVDPRVLLGQVKALLRARKAEQVLQEQARILDHIHDAVVAADLAGRVIRWNKGAERLFGYAPGEILGRHVGLLDPPGEGVAGFDRTLAVLRANGNCEGERVVVRKGGGEAHVHSSFSLVRNARGEASGMVWYSLDVSDRRRLEERVRQAEKLEAVGQLAGGVAHDFNNLLTVVTGFSDLVLGALAEEDPQRGLVQEIKRAGERAAALTQQLLAFGRRQLLTAHVLDLNAVVRYAEGVLRQTLGKIELRTVLAPDPGRVRADPGQLEVVLRNLAANAVDAMPEGGTLTLETRAVEFGEGGAGANPEVPRGPYVALSVTDTGTGMTAEVRARIFEPFFTTKKKGSVEGKGLGLSTVYGIVRQSGGSVEVRSEPGRGSTFTVYLPRVSAPGAPVAGELRGD